jgi:leader peptidase (prepilin peptidase)/N-methyltransferase
VVSGIDLSHRRIPNVVVGPLTAVGLVSAVVTDRVSLIGSVAGMVVGVALLGIVAIVSRGGMGMGDVKLLGMIGAWVGWRGVIISLFLGSIVASVAGLLLMMAGVIERRHPIPFGVFLSLGGLAVYLYEAHLLEMWLG